MSRTDVPPLPCRARRLGIGALALVSCLALPARGTSAEWGDDFDPAAGPELVEWVRDDLAAIVAAPQMRRAALVARVVAGDGRAAIEGLKRYRNPELRPLFHALLEHEDWHVVHRALLVLERYEDGSAWRRAWSLLSHAEPRLREKAAIACIRLWDAPGSAVPADAATVLAALLPREGDAHVRACLEALAARAGGTLPVERLSREVRVKGASGLILTPFLHRMTTARAVAPDWDYEPVSREGAGTAADLPVTARWTTPLLGFGREEPLPAGRRLQPFAHPRNGGRTVHTGEDVGAFLDGAGFYACADGIVKWIHSGSDMGTLIVLEHRVARDELATILYMHASDVVFVEAGARVRAGQLLGSMGLGYSFENGGHFAHLHLGAYPGAFRFGHNHGYGLASDGLRDWHDPIRFLRERIARSGAPAAASAAGSTAK